MHSRSPDLGFPDSVQDILESYPDLTIEDIQACIAYGAAMSRERFVPVELEPAA